MQGLDRQPGPQQRRRGRHPRHEPRPLPRPQRPVRHRGRRARDILVVDIVNIGPFEEQPWGYTAIFAKENGGGFLTDYSPAASKAIWDLDGIWTSSRHVPGARFIGNSHPGLFGCAPSPDLLAEWNRREQALIDLNPDRVTGDIPAHGGEVPGAPQVPALALPPLPKDALLGTLSGSDFERAAAEACRTIPPREHGGNVDIKDLGVGSRVYMPVFVPGGLFSIGDLHFGQGDGEITFCGAIEMPGFIDLHFDVIKGGMDRYKTDMPFFKPGRVGPNYSEFLTFEGISVEDGRNYYINATVAYRRACLNAINYLMPAHGLDVRAGLPVPRGGADRRSHRRGRRHPEQRGVGAASRCRSSTGTSSRAGPAVVASSSPSDPRRGRPGATRPEPARPTVPTSAPQGVRRAPVRDRCPHVRPLRPPAHPEEAIRRCPARGAPRPPGASTPLPPPRARTGPLAGAGAADRPGWTGRSPVSRSVTGRPQGRPLPSRGHPH